MLIVNFISLYPFMGNGNILSSYTTDESDKQSEGYFDEVKRECQNNLGSLKEVVDNPGVQVKGILDTLLMKKSEDIKFFDWETFLNAFVNEIVTIPVKETAEYIDTILGGKDKIDTINIIIHLFHTFEKDNETLSDYLNFFIKEILHSLYDNNDNVDNVDKKSYVDLYFSSSGKFIQYIGSKPDLMIGMYIDFAKQIKGNEEITLTNGDIEDIFMRQYDNNIQTEKTISLMKLGCNKNSILSIDSNNSLDKVKNKFIELKEINLEYKKDIKESDLIMLAISKIPLNTIKSIIEGSELIGDLHYIIKLLEDDISLTYEDIKFYSFFKVKRGDSNYKPTLPTLKNLIKVGCTDTEKISEVPSSIIENLFELEKRVQEDEGLENSKFVRIDYEDFLDLILRAEENGIKTSSTVDNLTKPDIYITNMLQNVVYKNNLQGMIKSLKNLHPNEDIHKLIAYADFLHTKGVATRNIGKNISFNANDLGDQDYATKYPLPTNDQLNIQANGDFHGYAREYYIYIEPCITRLESENNAKNVNKNDVGGEQEDEVITTEIILTENEKILWENMGGVENNLYFLRIFKSLKKENEECYTTEEVYGIRSDCKKVYKDMSIVSFYDYLSYIAKGYMRKNEKLDIKNIVDQFNKVNTIESKSLEDDDILFIIHNNISPKDYFTLNNMIRIEGNEERDIKLRWESYLLDPEGNIKTELVNKIYDPDFIKAFDEYKGKRENNVSHGGIKLLFQLLADDYGTKLNEATQNIGICLLKFLDNNQLKIEVNIDGKGSEIIDLTNKKESMHFLRMILLYIKQKGSIFPSDIDGQKKYFETVAEEVGKILSKSLLNSPHLQKPDKIFMLTNSRYGEDYNGAFKDIKHNSQILSKQWGLRKDQIVDASDDQGKPMKPTEYIANIDEYAASHPEETIHVYINNHGSTDGGSAHSGRTSFTKENWEALISLKHKNIVVFGNRCFGGNILEGEKPSNTLLLNSEYGYSTDGYTNVLNQYLKTKTKNRENPGVNSAETLLYLFKNYYHSFMPTYIPLENGEIYQLADKKLNTDKNELNDKKVSYS